MMKITLSGTFLRAPQSKMWVPPLDSVMKKLRIFLSIQLVLGLLISIPSLAATQLDVTGKGMVSVAPDEATITAQVSLVDRDAGKAQARASKEVDAMLSAIESFSLKPNSLNASELSLLPEYRWDRATDRQQFIGFRVTRTISFTIAEIDRLGAALSALANAGATLISSPVMGSSQAQEARDEALVKAVKDARKKLSLLARSRRHVAYQHLPTLRSRTPLPKTATHLDAGGNGARFSFFQHLCSGKFNLCRRS